MNLPAQSQRTINTQAIEIAIRLGVIFVIVMSCFNILTPFISLIMWRANNRVMTESMVPADKPNISTPALASSAPSKRHFSLMTMSP